MGAIQELEKILGRPLSDSAEQIIEKLCLSCYEAGITSAQQVASLTQINHVGTMCAASDGVNATLAAANLAIDASDASSAGLVGLLRDAIRELGAAANHRYAT